MMGGRYKVFRQEVFILDEEALCDLPRWSVIEGLCDLDIKFVTGEGFLFKWAQGILEMGI